MRQFIYRDRREEMEFKNKLRVGGRVRGRVCSFGLSSPTINKSY